MNGKMISFTQYLTPRTKNIQYKITGSPTQWKSNHPHMRHLVIETKECRSIKTMVAGFKFCGLTAEYTGHLKMNEYEINNFPGGFSGSNVQLFVGRFARLRGASDSRACSFHA